MDGASWQKQTTISGVRREVASTGVSELSAGGGEEVAGVGGGGGGLGGCFTSGSPRQRREAGHR